MLTGLVRLNHYQSFSAGLPILSNFMKSVGFQQAKKILSIWLWLSSKAPSAFCSCGWNFREASHAQAALGVDRGEDCPHRKGIRARPQRKVTKFYDKMYGMVWIESTEWCRSFFREAQFQRLVRVNLFPLWENLIPAVRLRWNWNTQLTHY